MNWSDAVVPLIVAAVGAIAVGIGAWIASRSALRSRLIDMTREDERERKAFQVRTVAAANELGTSTAHLISRRIHILSAVNTDARAKLGSTTAHPDATVQVDLEGLSAKEAARVSAATEAWRLVLAEAHVFALDETHNAIRAFDRQRATVVITVNAAMTQTDLLAAVIELEHAQELCNDLRKFFAIQVYRELQVEMLTGATRVFFLGHVWRLRHAVKEADKQHRRGIAEVRARVAVERTNRTAAPPS